MVKAIAILWVNDGAIVDPYWNCAEDWHDAARGDGASYGGVALWVKPNPGESQEDVLERARVRADQF